LTVFIFFSPATIFIFMYPTNEEIADVLTRIADLLEAQDANPYRVNAYRRAVRVISDLYQTAASMAISDDENKLEELELAAHDGRLEGVSGIGHRRARSIRDSVGAILNSSTRRRAIRFRAFEQTAEGTGDFSSTLEPSVAAILEVDRVYRQRAEAGQLKTIAPRRFNPAGKSWLPIMHTEKKMCCKPMLLPVPYNIEDDPQTQHGRYEVAHETQKRIAQKQRRYSGGDDQGRTDDHCGRNNAHGQTAERFVQDGQQGGQVVVLETQS
jgi:hypothetical protein